MTNEGGLARSDSLGVYIAYGLDTLFGLQEARKKKPALENEEEEDDLRFYQGTNTEGGDERIAK